MDEQNSVDGGTQRRSLWLSFAWDMFIAFALVMATYGLHGMLTHHGIPGIVIWGILKIAVIFTIVYRAKRRNRQYMNDVKNGNMYQGAAWSAPVTVFVVDGLIIWPMSVGISIKPSSIFLLIIIVGIMMYPWFRKQV
jgi:heme/copper-type cytochrome/quinol oxidase subunit 2